MRTRLTVIFCTALACASSVDAHDRDSRHEPPPPQHQQAATPALTIVAANGVVVGTVVGVTKLFGSDPTMVARQDNGTWITLPVDSEGVRTGSFPIFFTGDGCSGTAYAYFESSPAPLFRMVQRMTASDTVGFYPAGAVQELSFPAMQIEDFNNPGTKICVSAPANGWGGLLTVGLLQTIDLSQFPGPLTVK